MAVNLHGLDKGVARQQVRGDDTVKLTAQVAVEIFQAGGFFADDQVICNRADQLTIRNGMLSVFLRDGLSLDGILHMERRLFNKCHHRNIRMLIAQCF